MDNSGGSSEDYNTNRNVNSEGQAYEISDGYMEGLYLELN
jgi:hypothetical protein